jgi:hypothetical protein
VLWRELAYFEGYVRFAEVLALLRARYGTRLMELRRPTRESETYLYGDDLAAVRRVRGLNGELASLARTEDRDAAASDSEAPPARPMFNDSGAR